MRLPPVLAVLASVVAWPAFANADSLPVLVRTKQPTNEFLAARLQGKLHLDDAGCLRVAGHSGDPGPFVIWNHGSRIERIGDGRIRITDGFSGKSAHIGDEVVMGGGAMTVMPTEGLAAPVPEVCASGTFWVAAVLSEAAPGSDTSSSVEPSRFGTSTKPMQARPAGVPENDVPAIPAHGMEPDTGPLSAALQERFRDRIAGIYIEREPDFHVVVRLTGDRDAGTLQYQLGEDRIRVEVRSGALHTVDQLRAAFDRRDTIARFLPAGYGGYVDERRGGLVLTVDIGTRIATGNEAALSEALGVPVRIVEQERAVIAPAPLHGIE